MKTTVPLYALFFLAHFPAFCAPVSAGDLSSTCQKASRAINSKGKWEGKRPEDIYGVGQCEGFLEGWVDGIDGTILRGKNGLLLVSVKRDQIKSMWDIATTLADYLKTHPLESSKPVDSVLQEILQESGLLTARPYQNPGSAPEAFRPGSQLSFERSASAPDCHT